MARILIIDDDLQIRVALRHLLSSNGHDVEEAVNGEDGIVCYQEHPADLVILDIMMPGINGLEVIEILQKDFPKVRIVTLSAAHQVGRANLLPASILLGALRAVRKPFESEYLLSVIDELLP
jgi:CheY-like chemotaxis protein